MKLYINNFNLNILNDIHTLLESYVINSETFTELYTNEGIYLIENKNIFILESIDRNIKIHEKYYKELTVIVDPSNYKKIPTSSVHGDKHFSQTIKKDYYKLDKNIKYIIVIEHIINNMEGKTIPHNIYLEFNDDVDINELFIKKEIIEFLSLLN